jgi:hypothetical protein
MGVKGAVLALLGAGLLCGCGGSHEELSLVTPRLSLDRALAEEFARLFDDPDFIRIRLVPNPNPEEPGSHVVSSGAADLALVPNSEPYDPNLATVVPLYPTVLHIAYRSDMPVGDNGNLLLEGTTVFAGPPGSPSRALLETAARRDGITPDQIDYVQEGCADVLVVYAPILPDVPSRIGDCGSYRLYSLGKPEDIGTGSAVDSVSLINPKLKPFVIPANTYGDLTPEPVVTLAVDKLLVARRDLPNTVIYDLLGEVLRLKPALSARYPGLFYSLTDDFDVSGSAFVLHPGALAYLQRDEPDVYERYSGVAEVLVTLLIGLVSGVYAIFRIYSFRRKNRIDAFCREAIDIRDGVRAQASADRRRAAVSDLRALQDRAYDMLIHEKLAADESFRIFITLSNDIIAELDDRSATQPG